MLGWRIGNLSVSQASISQNSRKKNNIEYIERIYTWLDPSEDIDFTPVKTLTWLYERPWLDSSEDIDLTWVKTLTWL